MKSAAAALRGRCPRLIKLVMAAGAMWVGAVKAESLNAALDNEEVVFAAIGNGSVEWAVDGVETHDGVDSLRSPVVPVPPVGSQRYFGIESEIEGPAEVVFWWKHQGGGVLRVFVDHSWTSSMPTGGAGWSRASVTIGLGRHHLQWRTDVSFGATEEGAFWLDAIEIIRPALAITNGPLAEGEVGQPFRWQVTTTHPALEFGAAPLPAGLEVEPATGWITGVPTGAEETRTRLSAVSTEASAEAWVRIRIMPPAVALDEALDGEGMVWSVSPGTVWRGRNLGSGGDAGFPDRARQVYFPEVPDYASYRLETTVTGPEVVTFWWVPSGSGFSSDALKLSVGGTVITPRHVPGLARSAWRDERIEIPPGQHTLRWEQSGADWTETGLDRVTRAGSPQLCLTGVRQIWVPAGSPVHEHIKINRAGARFAATGLPAGLYLESETGILRGTPTLAGDWVCDLTATLGADTAAMKLVVSVTELNLGLALGQAQRSWTQQNAGWQRFGEHGLVRYPALQGDGATGSTETLTFETEVVGPDRVTFEWDCSYSFLLGGIHASWTLAVDGAAVRSRHFDTGEGGVIPGVMGWKSESVAVPAGPHRVQWRFTGSRAQPCCPPGVQGMVRAIRFESDATDYAGWAARSGLNGPLSAPDQNADADQSPNWTEYALQSNPIAVDAPWPPTLTRVGPFLEIDFALRPGGPTDLDYTVEESSSLAGPAWYSAMPRVVFTAAGRMLVRTELPSPGAAGRYFRLVAARPHGGFLRGM